VDDEGCAYLTGETESDENTFPVFRGPDLTYNEFSYPLDSDGFVAKVNADGTGLVYCGYIGGTFPDEGIAIAVDAEGRAVVGGFTASNETNFPVKVGPDVKYNGYGDAFVARVQASGLALEYCGYIGGADYDQILSVALDEDGNAYVGGSTQSLESGFPPFPVKVGPDLTANGYYDGFVAKVSASGADLEYCGYIGGLDIDKVFALAVDGVGCAYASGDTESAEDTFPVKVGPDLTFNNALDISDGFVAKVNASGSDLVYCGYIGGDDDDWMNGIAVDSEGKAYLAGSTFSGPSTFPVKAWPDQTLGGSLDAFIAAVNSEGTDLIFCGYHGGDDSETATGIALDGKGHLYLAGRGHSDEASMPVKIGPDLTYNGDGDAYMTKFIIPLATDTGVLSEAGGTVNFALFAGEANAQRSYLLLGGLSGTQPGHPLPGGMETLPLNWDAFTDLVLLLANTVLFDDFLGVLDGTGKAQARLEAPALPPGYVGTRIHFAYCLSSPFDFASMPVEIEIVP
jgi:hypothetical protein